MSLKHCIKLNQLSSKIIILLLYLLLIYFIGVVVASVDLIFLNFLKGTVSVISSGLQFIEMHVQFTTVPMSDSQRYPCPYNDEVDTLICIAED